MPRAKRPTTSGQNVYVLEHRIPAIARRKYPFHTKNRVLCTLELQRAEYNNVPFSVETNYMTRWTGMMKIYSLSGTAYKVHETDVVRV